MAEWFPRLFLGALFGRESVDLNGIALGAARFTNVAALLAMPIFNAGRTQAINDIAEAGQREAVLRYEDAIVRALEDVENALVALGDERQRAADAGKRCGIGRSGARPRAIALQPRPDRPAAAARCAARAPGRARRRQRQPTRNCCSTACSSTRRSAADGRSSSRSREPAQADAAPPRIHEPSTHRGTAVKTSLARVLLVVPIAALLSGCSDKPPPEPLRAVRTVEIRYDKTQETDRYVGTVQSRHEVDQAFRVGGKVVERKVDVGQKVREGDVLAVLDDADYRLAEEAAQQQLAAAHDAGAAGGIRSPAAGRAEDRRLGQRLRRREGAEQRADDARPPPKPTRASSTSRAIASSTRCCARRRTAWSPRASSRSARSSPKASPSSRSRRRASPRSSSTCPRITCRPSRRRGTRPGSRARPTRRSTSCCANCRRRRQRQTRTFRARLKPATPRPLPLGATATLVVERPVARTPAAAIPAAAITQNKGQPAVWVVRRAGTEPVGTVDLIGVAVHGYRNDEVLVSGPQAGELVVTAGVQKMAPGLKVALPGATPNVDTKQAAR